MPIGIIVNLSAVCIGGLIGSAVGTRLPRHLSDNLNLIFGLASMGMGISATVLMENMPAVILAVILGTEGEGLTDAAIDASDYVVRIPMEHGVDSLNVAAASAVAFWELGNRKRLPVNP